MRDVGSVKHFLNNNGSIQEINGIVCHEIQGCHAEISLPICLDSDPGDDPQDGRKEQLAHRLNHHYTHQCHKRVNHLCTGACHGHMEEPNDGHEGHDVLRCVDHR